MAEGLGQEVARWVRELRKGSARLALLTVLADGESYGYQILQNLRSRWAEAVDGVPARKYYRMTRDGQSLLPALRAAWKEFRNEMDKVTEA
ncbi:MAG: PadR family transcriptional regulator [Euryarchaeota archaeon]|nr:PadR family transcriptional regulator [Euryarchaeota archaeon]